MRFHSTPESAENLEITKLAIIETLLSIAIYVCLGLYLGTFKYLALAVVFAPLVLFRTKESAEWGIASYGKWLDKLDTVWGPDNQIRLQNYNLSKRQLLIVNTLMTVWVIIAMALGGFIIRIAATVIWGVRTPLSMLREAPLNWLRQSLCTDFYHQPEIVPLETLRWGNTQHPTFMSIIEDIRRVDIFSDKLFILLLSSPLVIIGYLPSLIYGSPSKPPQ